MLEVCDLAFDYHDMPLLKAVNFKLQPGALLHLRGENGAGKTTLFRVLAGLFYPTSGEIRYQGKNIYDQMSLYHQDLCFIGHKSGTHPLLTVEENIKFDLKSHSNQTAIERSLQLMNLDSYRHQLCEHLSAGQQRRVSLLKMFLSDAPLWLLDEPLVALDHQAVQIVVDRIQQHRKQGGIVLMTSHQPLMLPSEDYQEYQL